VFRAHRAILRSGTFDEDIYKRTTQTINKQHTNIAVVCMPIGYPWRIKGGVISLGRLLLDA
jgi:hypothetical protein